MKIEALFHWLKTGNHMLYIILTIGTVFTYFWFISFKKQLKLNAATAVPAALIHTVFGVLCVKAFAVAETANLENLGNMSIFGATFFMPILFFTYAKLTKCSMAEVFDIGTISMMFTLMCSRFNCLVSGCCRGLPFFGSESFSWPTRELEIIFYIVLLMILGIRVKRGTGRGQSYPIYMLAYGVFRFLIEWVRVYDGSSVIHRAHIWSLISLGLGISILAEIINKQNKQRIKEMKK